MGVKGVVVICAALFGRDLERMKADDGAVMDPCCVDDVDRQWSDVDARSSELPVLREFIYSFTETRVRSELAERRRSLPRSSTFLPHHSSARLKVPSYRRVGGNSYPSDVGRGRIDKILKSVIVQTLSEKLHPLTRRRAPAWTSAGYRAVGGLSLADVQRAPVTADTMDSRSSSSDDCGVPVLAEDLDHRRGPPGRKTRPKRGHYRKYNRQLLLDAVRAVQKGDMSVHRAGSFYGVPHSTLEYKVKERHLLRQRKTAESAAVRSRRHEQAEDPERHPRPSREPVAPDVEPPSKYTAAESYLTRLRGGAVQWPYDAATSDPIPPWNRLFHPPDISSLSAASSPALRLPPPPPLLPFDLMRTLPVGFGWPPAPPFLAGMFDGSVDSRRIPTHPFSMSASDLLKSFQQKAVASGDVRQMADDDRLAPLFPVLGDDVTGRNDDDAAGSPSQVAVG